jgi:fucI: L-fucose isomerase
MVARVAFAKALKRKQWIWQKQ